MGGSRELRSLFNGAHVQRQVRYPAAESTRLSASSETGGRVYLDSEGHVPLPYTSFYAICSGHIQYTQPSQTPE